MAFSSTDDFRSLGSARPEVSADTAPVRGSHEPASLRHREHAPTRSESDQRTVDESVGLLAAIARRDAPAFEALYHRYARVMFSLALRIVGSRPEAEDIVSEVFIKVWDRAGDFESPLGSVFGWLATITRRKAIDRLRIRSRRCEIEAELADSLNAEDSGPTARTILVDQERRERVRVALRGVNARDRRVVELAYFSGLSRQQIAERLKMPTGTAKAIIRRALFALRRQLTLEAEPLGQPGESLASR